MRPARWLCKTCKTFGYGGPAGYQTHAKQHVDYQSRNAQASFGFAPNYSNGVRSYNHWIAPVRMEGEQS